MKMLVIFLLFFGIVGCAEISEENKTENALIEHDSTHENASTPIFHSSHEPKKQSVPFSDAVQVGTTFYLSGQIGMDHSVRELVNGGITAETKQTLENIKAVLSYHGMTLNHVVKATVILDDIEDFTAFNTVYSEYLPQKPARTTFAAQGLARGAKIEIEVVAVKTAL